MSKSYTASSIIEEARDWADEALDDYAYKKRFIGKRDRNNINLNKLLVSHFSFILQILLLLFNLIFTSFSPVIFYDASKFGLISILLLCFLFMVQTPLICWTASKLYK